MLHLGGGGGGGGGELSGRELSAVRQSCADVGREGAQKYGVKKDITVGWN
jgi:hypothetical protein